MEFFEDPQNPGEVYIRLLRQDLLEELFFSKRPGRLVVCMVDREFLVYRPEKEDGAAASPSLDLMVRDVGRLLDKGRRNGFRNGVNSSVHIFTDVDLYDVSDELAKELDVRVFCHFFHR
ncbi:unnamed protein product [Ixodes pacificus]